MLEIRLNGEYSLDINDDINLLMTYQVGDVRNFLGSNSNYSKTISIAGTSNNNKAFGCLFDITNDSTRHNKIYCKSSSLPDFQFLSFFILD